MSLSPKSVVEQKLIQPGTFRERILAARAIAQASGDEKARQPKYGRFLKEHATIYVSYFLARIGVRANWVTAAMASCCVAAGLCFIPRNIYLNLAGVILVHVMYFLDIVDGEVARLRQECSILGVYLDYATHQIANPLFALGFGLHIYLVDGSIFVLATLLVLYSAVHIQRGMVSAARATLFVTGYRATERKTYKGLTDWKKTGGHGHGCSGLRTLVIHVFHSAFTIPMFTLLGLSLVASYYCGTPFLCVVLALYTGLTVLATTGMIVRDARWIAKARLEE